MSSSKKHSKQTSLPPPSEETEEKLAPTKQPLSRAATADTCHSINASNPVMLINDSDDLEKPMHKKLEGKPMYEEKRQEAME